MNTHNLIIHNYTQMFDSPCMCTSETPGHPQVWIWEITLQSPLFGQQRRDSLAMLIGCMILGWPGFYRETYGIISICISYLFDKIWIYREIGDIYESYGYVFQMFILLCTCTFFCERLYSPHGLHPDLENRTGRSRSHSLQRCLTLYMVHPFTSSTPTWFTAGFLRT